MGHRSDERTATNRIDAKSARSGPIARDVEKRSARTRVNPSQRSWGLSLRKCRVRAIRVSMIAKTGVDEETCSILREKNPLGVTIHCAAAHSSGTSLDSPR